MLIKSVELKNVKSYRRETIEFREGINGICGQNGHGKTTILEAIGYVLFHHLPYKESDFLRRGEKSGYVSVEVLVNGTSYTITRKFGSTKEYSVRGMNINISGEKDVLAWLNHNLFPISDQDELPRIFENAVGVPQGMFTSAFLETPAKRRKTFDEILKVEEYRNAYENLRGAMSLIDEGVRKIETEIEILRVRTENYTIKKGERDSLLINIQALRKELNECKENLNTAKSKRDLLKNQKTALERLESEIKQGRIKLEGLKQQLEKSRVELKKAEEAQKILAGLSGDKEKYEESKNQLDGFEKMRRERDALRENLNVIQYELSMMNEKRSRIDAIKAEVEKSIAERDSLAPGLEEQAELERKIENKKEERAVAIKEINDIKSMKSLAGSDNICPLIKGLRCKSVMDFTSYFREQSAEAEKKLAIAEDYLKELNMKLKELGNVRGRMNALETLIKRGFDESEKLTKEIKKIQEKESAHRALKYSLEKYSTIDSDIEEVKKKIGELEPLYKKYLQNQTIAAQFEEYENERRKLEKAIADEETKQRDAEEKYLGARAVFSDELLETVEHTYIELGAKATGFQVKINEKEGQLQKLSKDIEEMEKYLANIAEQESKLRIEREFMSYAKFIRETLRDSAQHIVLEFIGEISEEASSLYCAIMDDFSQELRWSEDYGITITEYGEGKSFFQLSGGERMGAALALRLALLKVLANSDFIFLDEPTQNLDEIRRENLSEQIMNIKGFKQVFVISHDDTFNEKYTHVVTIQKLDGESKVVV